MTRIKGIVRTVVAIAGVATLSSPVLVSAAEGVAQGESSQQKGQQGVGLTEADQVGSGVQSSNVLMGGPEIITGKISKIDGEQYSIKGDRGQEISLRVTKDTNTVCANADKAKFSTGHEGVEEQKEIPPTPFMKEQSGKSGQGQQAITEEQMAKQHDDPQGRTGAISKDPSKLKDKVGTTDKKAQEDIARGSGFSVGNCNFQVGDQVRVEASDMGTATTIRQLASSQDHGQ